MDKSPGVRLIGKITWAITALASLHIGLTLFGIDISRSMFFLMLPGLARLLKVVIGLSGLISLGMMIMSCGKCGCGSSGCTCGSKMGGSCAKGCSCSGNCPCGKNCTCPVKCTCGDNCNCGSSCSCSPNSCKCRR